MERRLSAILAVDVVGYSRLMERDEADAFERLRAHRKDLFEPEIAGHHGRIFKLMGDGLLAEFGSVVNAVECAVLLQREMAERNNGLPADQRIDVRMGLHVGDVIIEGDDRHGDAVNIAARLQQLAETGGICVSGAVVDHIRHKVALRFEPRGTERLKNIAEPVTVYRVALDLAPKAQARRGRSLRIWAAAAAASLLIVAAGVAAALYGVPGINAPPPAISEQGIPVIIVLPFSDLTGSQAGTGAIDLAKVGAGIAEEFITDLSTFPDFQVVSSTSSFAYAGKPIPEIVAATGATFVIEGSIRSSADKAMITMQLIDGKSDRHLRTSQIEEIIADPVAMQRAIVAKLRNELGGMTGVLRHESEQTAWKKAESDLTEYDYYLRGHTYALRSEGSDWPHAYEQWSKGLTRFPNSALLRCKLTLFYLFGKSSMKEAQQMVDEATPLPKQSRLDEWYFHWARAVVLIRDNGDHKRAVAEARAVTAMAPYDTLSHNNMAWVLYDAGLYDEALDWFKFAVTDPNPLDWYFDALLDGFDGAQRWPEAIELAKTEITSNPSPNKNWYKVLARAYAATNQLEKSKETWKIFEGLPSPAGP